MLSTATQNDVSQGGNLLASPHGQTVLHARIVSGTGGGPDKTILNSPRFLADHGFDSACLFFHPPDDDGFDVVRDRAAGLGAPLVEIEDRGRFDWRAIRRATQVCRERNVTIWHAHDYKTNLIGLILRRFHRMNLVTTAHGWVHFAGQTPLYYRLEKRWWLPRYEKVICVSDTVLRQCLDAGVPAARCVLIENAIDRQQFRRQRSAETAKREQFGVPEDQLLIGSIGRLAEEKGFDLLIQAFANLVGQGINAKLVIAGEGPDRAFLERAIADSGIGDRIELIGFCQDTRAFFEALDIFVLSSRREGLPNVLLEAMAVGAPVIATRVGGVQHVLQDDVNGSLIEADDATKLASALIRLATSPQQRLRYSAAGIETIKRDWCFDKRMSKIVDVYQELLAPPRTSALADAP